MNKSLKKVFAVFLLTVMLMSASCGKSDSGKSTNDTAASSDASASLTTDAEGGWFESFGEYRFYTNGKEASIAAYVGKDKNITLPAFLKDVPVVSAAWSAFAKNTAIEEVTVPENIRILGVGAFAECTSLKKVVLPSSLKKIDINCFSGCSALAEITVGENVEEIGVSAFSGCISLSAVGCDEKNVCFSSVNGVLYSADKEKLMLYPAGKRDEAYTVANETLSIADRAFEGNVYIESVDLKNVIDIGSYSFKDCTNLLNISHDKDIAVAGGAFENTFYESKS